MSWPSGERMAGLQRRWARQRLVRSTVVFCAVLMLVLLGEALLANALLKPVSRDEHMYCAAAVLLGQGQLMYRDFSYPAQLPYHPLLLAAVYRLFGTTHYLLAGRLVSVVCDILVVLAIVGIYGHVFGRRCLEALLFGLAAAVFYVFNPQVDYAAGHAWNHDLVVLCVVLALWLFITVDFRRRSSIWGVAAMGALLTLATCARVTTALVEGLFLAAIIVAAGGSVRNRLRTALPFSLAALAVAAWPIWVCAQAPQALWLNLVRIPALYGRWLHEVGMAHGKITMAAYCLTAPGYLALLAVGAYLVWTAARRWSQMNTNVRRNLVLTLLVCLAFSVIAFIPPTMWEQYWAVPVPFLAVALAYPLAELSRQAEVGRDERRFKTATWAVFIAATATAIANPAVLGRLQDATVPEHWRPIILHKIAADISAQSPEPKRVLTLGPLYALEGGADIYPELSCGSIVYRIADSLSASERALTQSIGPSALASLAERSGPAAVVVGIEPPPFSALEEPLRALTGPDWLRHTYPTGVEAYLRP